MSNKVYSLSQYQLIINVPEFMKKYLTEEEANKGLTIGGQGTLLDKITIALNENTWSVKGDALGSWVHSMNLNRTGTISVTLNQVSNTTTLLHKLVKVYYTKNTGLLNNNDLEFNTITLMNSLGGEPLVTATSCYLQKTPNRSFGNTPENETWTFVCGEIIINSN